MSRHPLTPQAQGHRRYHHLCNLQDRTGPGLRLRTIQARSSADWHSDESIISTQYSSASDVSLSSHYFTASGGLAPWHHLILEGSSSSPPPPLTQRLGASGECEVLKQEYDEKKSRLLRA